MQQKKKSYSSGAKFCLFFGSKYKCSASDDIDQSLPLVQIVLLLFHQVRLHVFLHTYTDKGG